MNYIQNESPWFPYNQMSGQETVRLFCFPYGGGNAIVFRQWQLYLPDWIQVFPVQLPGRGIRIQESSFQQLDLLIEELAEAIFPYLDRPFFFFGHSMGALLGFELTRFLRDHKRKQPVHLFVSGYHAPQLPDPNPPIHHLPQQEFIDEIAKMNGTPEELLTNPEYINIFLPSLRADFQLCETYQYRSGEPLTCPITAFGGKEDPETSVEMLRAWKKQTVSRFELEMFSGDHFFIHSEEKALVERIKGEILNIKRGCCQKC